MGAHKIEIVMVGGHGCDRTAQPGEQLNGCGAETCPDCAARAFVEAFKARGAFNFNEAYATFTHWPGQAAQVIDDLVTGTRKCRTFADPEEREFLAQFFEYGHLRPDLQEVSRPFGELAMSILATLPRNPERTVALRKLLEAKDCAVRARNAK